MVPIKGGEGRRSVIAFVIKTNEGGLWIVPQVREALARGSDVFVVIPEGEGRLARALEGVRYREPLLEVVRVPFDFRLRPRPATLRGIWAVRKILRRTRADVVLYHLYASALVVRFATLGMRGIRKIHMIAGPLYLENKTIQLVERFLHRMDTEIIAGSDFTRDRYRELGASSQHLHSVPYGVDLDRFSPSCCSRQEARDALGLSQSDFVVVMVALVYAPKSLVFPGVGIKGHNTLLEAWSEFAKGHSNVKLVLVGSGFDEDGQRHRTELIARGVELGLSESTIWMDRVEDVRIAYRTADLSVSPSLSENHGAAAEASAMGVPSIVSDAGALPESLPNGVGWIFPAGDARALARCLSEAYVAWESGRLEALAPMVRTHMLQNFELSECVRKVIDIAFAESVDEEP